MARGRPPKNNIAKTFSIPVYLWEKVEKKLKDQVGEKIPVGVRSKLIIELLDKWEKKE